MTMLKLFLPSGANINADTTVTLSDGQVLPGWAFAAVAIEDTGVDKAKVPDISQTTARYVDVLSGDLSNTSTPGTTDYVPGQTFFGGYDFSKFSRYADADKLLTALENALPLAVADALAGQSDPGYFEAVPSARSPTTEVALDSTDFTKPDEYPMGQGIYLSQLLTKGGIRQDLAVGQGATESDIVLNLKYVVANVIGGMDSENTYLDSSASLFVPQNSFDYIIYSGYVNPSRYSQDEEAYLGQVIRLEFSASPQQVYQKAIDMATKIPFDRIWLDYRSDGDPIVTVICSSKTQAKKVGTRYDGTVVADDKLLNLVKGADTTGINSPPDPGPLSTISYDSNDDYAVLENTIRSNMSLFGGPTAATNLLGSLGFNQNPYVSQGSTGTSNLDATKAKSISSSLTCPGSSVDPNLYPTSSHPHLRHMSDLGQLDSSSTQDVIPFSLRANNPMKVRTIKGVTDLKTRFGYLGDSNGYAVYRDHVGGAAAGLAYVMSMGGSTIGAATRGILGSSLTGSGGGDGLDSTAISPGRIFSGISSSLFGAKVKDPSGVTQECSTIKPDDMESTISYGAALSKSVSGLKTNPLTHDEWASAYQIAKNQPNQHLKRATTGASLPVTEETNTADTAALTSDQSKETRDTTDYNKRGKNEAFNPISNFTHYASIWSNWVSSGRINYTQKSGAGDSTGVAKSYQTEVLDQKSTHPTGVASLDWTEK